MNQFYHQLHRLLPRAYQLPHLQTLLNALFHPAIFLTQAIQTMHLLQKPPHHEVHPKLCRNFDQTYPRHASESLSPQQPAHLPPHVNLPVYLGHYLIQLLNRHHLGLPTRYHSDQLKLHQLNYQQPHIPYDANLSHHQYPQCTYQVAF